MTSGDIRNSSGSEDRAKAQKSSNTDSFVVSPAMRILIVVAGLVLLGVGIGAVFATENGTGAGALITIGAGVAAFGLFEPWIDALEAFGVKVSLERYNRRSALADELERQGDADEAEAVRANAIAEVASEFPSVGLARRQGIELEGALIDALRSLGYNDLIPETRSRDLGFDVGVRLADGRTLIGEAQLVSDLSRGRRRAQETISRLAAHARAVQEGRFVLVLLLGPGKNLSGAHLEPLAARLNDWVERSSADVHIRVFIWNGDRERLISELRAFVSTLQ